MTDKPTPSRINWTDVREQYVVGDSTAAEIAQRLGVSVRTVNEHAAARNSRNGNAKPWSVLRSEYRENVATGAQATAREVALDQAARRAERAAAVQIEQELRVDELADEVFAQALAALRAGELRGADIIKIGLAVLTFQRRVRGLDEVTPIKVELSEKEDRFSGQPLGGALDWELQQKAQRLLEGVFGAANDPQ